MSIRRIIGYARMGRRLAVVGTRSARVALWVTIGIALGCASTAGFVGRLCWAHARSATGRKSLPTLPFLRRLCRRHRESKRHRRCDTAQSRPAHLDPGSEAGAPLRNRSQDAGAGSRGRRAGDLKLIWPVSGKLSSRFGWRNGRGHDGIDIPAKSGTPIVAAAAGRVIHSGRGLGDYGRVVILKHEGYYSTVYAHNRRNRVGKGDFVEKGEVIGEVGSSGNASGSHVHFEVRLNRKPLDPLLFLP